MEIATSNQGRPLRLRIEGYGPRTVLWVGGIHGDEPEGRAATDNLASAFAELKLGALATLAILEDDNPDGRAAHSRTNGGGIDLNRNFPSANFAPSTTHGLRPVSEPESAALASVVCQLRPDLIMVAHSAHSNNLANAVDPDGPAAAAATQFAERGAMKIDHARYPTPGSLGSWAGVDGHLAVLTIEYQQGIAPDAAWLQTRAAILGAIEG